MEAEEIVNGIPLIPKGAIQNKRIARLQRRYQSEDLFISVERARYYTQSWKSTEGRGFSKSIRIALAMKNVYENMTHYIDFDDRIAGHWTECFLGIPIDIERGVFNQVLEGEMTKKSIILHRGRSFAKGLKYFIRKGGLIDFFKNQSQSKKSGAPPLDMGFATMSQRKINPYQIRKADQDELLNELLPFWRGKTTVDKVEEKLIESELYSKDMHDFAIAIPGNTSRQVSMITTCATIATYQGHMILDYEKVLKVGLSAMKRNVRKQMETKNLNSDEKAFLESLEIALDGVSIFARRLALAIEDRLEDKIDPTKNAALENMLANCIAVPEKPAKTFRQAVQALWTIKTAVELAHPVNLHCFGRLDQILIGYYRNDIKAGRIDAESACELLQELLLKIMSQNIRPESNILGNFYHRFLGSSPVTVGGVKPDGKDATNELTYLFLKAAHGSKAITNMSVRISRSTPKDVLDHIAQYLTGQTSSFSLFNDEINIEAMKKRGFSIRDARNYAIMGCVEATCPGKTGSMGANALLLSRLLDITLRNGDSRILVGTIRGEGPKTGDPDSFENFEQFLEALFKQGDYFIRKIVDGSNIRDEIYRKELPAPFISAFVDGCLKSKKDVTAGGAKYNLAGISMINSIANMVDSLFIIENLIFKKRAFDFKTLLKAVDNNFIGYEKILKQIQDIPGKWGNGNPEADDLAARVMKSLFKKTYEHRTTLDGAFVVYIISMITHTLDGRLSAAGPDGRRASTPYAASCNPYNVERCGATAALRSVAALPFEDVMGGAVNMKFHPSALGSNRRSRDKWASLIRAYFNLGGSQLQPTVVSRRILEDARDNPENHRDLIVKVGGYSTYFVDIGMEIQDEVILRTEHH